MPVYLYECRDCKSQFESVHGINESIDECQVCQAKDTLFLIPQFTIKKGVVSIKKTKVGSLVNSHIEESKKELKKEKQKLKREIYDG